MAPVPLPAALAQTTQLLISMGTAGALCSMRLLLFWCLGVYMVWWPSRITWHFPGKAYVGGHVVG